MTACCVAWVRHCESIRLAVGELLGFELPRGVPARIFLSISVERSVSSLLESDAAASGLNSIIVPNDEIGRRPMRRPDFELRVAR